MECGWVGLRLLYDIRETWTSRGSATSDLATLGKIGWEVRRSGNRFNTAMATAPPVKTPVLPYSPRVPSSRRSFATSVTVSSSRSSAKVT